MKKGTIWHNWRHCRKWIATWTVLILILSFISLSAGSGNETENHENAGTDPNSKVVSDKDIQSGESTEENLESKEKLETDKDKQKTDTDKQKDNTETREERAKQSNSTDDQESLKEIMEIKTETKKDTGNQENLEKSSEIKETESDNTDKQKGSEIESGTKTKEEIDFETKTNVEIDFETKTKEEIDFETKTKEEVDSETKTETEKDSDIQEIIEKNSEVQTGAKGNVSSQRSAEKKPETKKEASDSNDYKGSAEKNLDTGIKKVTDNQKNPEKNQETGKVERSSTDNQASACKAPAQKEKAEEKSETQENLEAKLKQKTCVDKEKDNSENPGKKTEMKTGSCDELKNLKIGEVKTETKEKACRGTKNLKGEELKPESKIEAFSKGNNLKSDVVGAQIKIEGTNWSDIPENKELKPEIKSGKSSWNKLKFILSYPRSLRSFYITSESVKIIYKGSESLKGQKVDVYLVKTHSSSFSERTVKNITDGTISFEDIFSNNPEFYIQIPETLNKGGDLSPMTLGPLPEGSYWVVVTLAEKETKASEPEKTILLAHYFKVFEYEMKAASPRELEEGENLEVDISLKNAPAQKNYTYWAVLIREDACGTSTYIGSNTNGIKTISGTLLQGLRLIEDFGLNSTEYESEIGKDKLKNEILDFIGESNATISIGEENQNILSLTTSCLHPGNYLLFAGAYENDKGFTGITQKEVSINEDRKLYGSNKKQESNTDISTESQNTSSMKTRQLVLDTVNPLGLEGLKPQIREETLLAAGVVKTPSKLASFLMGFVGTLLIGIAMLKRRR
ncbi:MAG: TIGR04279 domain-containing protein [Euryarchaeota archaeon]|nr:TIGR04279 domain-containing protein [Euryarchaeota archaeon]